MLHLRRFIGAMIVMIAFLAASSAVQAHGGHDHVASAHAQASADQDAASVSSTARDAVNVATISARMETLHPVRGERCLGGCCSSAHICCAAYLPAGVSAIFPVRFGASHPLFRSLLRDGLTPEGLRKPPRSFA